MVKYTCKVCTDIFLSDARPPKYFTRGFCCSLDLRKLGSTVRKKGIGIMNYQIMSGDILTAEWIDGKLNIIDEAHLPLFLKNFSDLNAWLETRAIDSHRANSRLLKKALRLAERDDVNTVLAVNAATITDNYWIREFGSSLSYADIKFDNDYFAALALHGSYDSFNRAALAETTKTPELTNIGSFEKCWKLQDGHWWLHKTASDEELFSELFIYELGKRLGITMAECHSGEHVLESLDFTNAGEVILEHASSFMGDNDDYDDVLSALEKICPQAIPDYVRMIFLDTITANPDRHTANFGLLRDAATGQLLGLAPLFDHNMALISRGYPKPFDASKKDMLISLFLDVLNEHREYAAYIPTLTEEILAAAAEAVDVNVRKNEVTDFVWQRYLAIRQHTA